MLDKLKKAANAARQEGRIWGQATETGKGSAVGQANPIPEDKKASKGEETQSAHFGKGKKGDYLSKWTRKT